MPTPRTLTEAPPRAAFGKRCEAADFIAMLATAEAFKLLAGYADQPSAAIIEFDGFATSVRVLP